MLIVLTLAVALLFALAFRQAHQDPIVRRVELALPGWPVGATPVLVALTSDVHVGGGAMDAGRLTRIMDQIAANRPDLALFAGDFISGHDPQTARDNAPVITAAFSRLRPKYGKIGVLGNHDHDSDPGAIAAALSAGGVTVLENRAQVRGPLVVAGIGDAFSGHNRLPDTLRSMRKLAGVRLALTHSPDIALALPSDVTILLAGHTHCGQIVLPWVGALRLHAHPRYRCGIVREGARTIIITAGLGTSLLPLRLNAPPDVWLIRLGGTVPVQN